MQYASAVVFFCVVGEGGGVSFILAVDGGRGSEGEGGGGRRRRADAVLFHKELAWLCCLADLGAAAALWLLTACLLLPLLLLLGGGGAGGADDLGVCLVQAAAGVGGRGGLSRDDLGGRALTISPHAAGSRGDGRALDDGVAGLVVSLIVVVLAPDAGGPEHEGEASSELGRGGGAAGRPAAASAMASGRAASGRLFVRGHWSSVPAAVAESSDEDHGDDGDDDEENWGGPSVIAESGVQMVAQRSCFA